MSPYNHVNTLGVHYYNTTWFGGYCSAKVLCSVKVYPICAQQLNVFPFPDGAGVENVSISPQAENLIQMTLPGDNETKIFNVKTRLTDYLKIKYMKNLLPTKILPKETRKNSIAIGLFYVYPLKKWISGFQLRKSIELINKILYHETQLIILLINWFHLYNSTPLWWFRLLRHCKLFTNHTTENLSCLLKI